jgi:hypothetical protein
MAGASLLLVGHSFAAGSNHSSAPAPVYNPPAPVYIPPPPRQQPVYQSAPAATTAPANQNTCTDANGRAVPCQQNQPQPAPVRQVVSPPKQVVPQVQPTQRVTNTNPVRNNISVPVATMAAPSSSAHVLPAPTPRVTPSPTLSTNTSATTPRNVPAQTSSASPTRMSIAPPVPTETHNLGTSPTRITLSPIEPRQNQIVITSPNAAVAGPTTPMVQASQQPTRISIAPILTPGAAVAVRPSPSATTTWPATGMAATTPSIASATGKSAVDGAVFIYDKTKQLEESKPGQIIIDMGVTAGGSLAPGHIAAGLGHASDAADVYNAYKANGWSGADEKIIEKGTVQVGGAAGALMMPWAPVAGNAIGSAVTQGTIDAGTTYVSPWLADRWIAGDQRFFGGKIFGEGPAK